MARGQEFDFMVDGQLKKLTITEIQKFVPGRSWDWIKRGLDTGAKTVPELSMAAAKRQVAGARLSLKLSRKSEGRNKLW